jgi:hypothetical protein
MPRRAGPFPTNREKRKKTEIGVQTILISKLAKAAHAIVAPI